jgi:hypothetical protein
MSNENKDQKSFDLMILSKYCIGEDHLPLNPPISSHFYLDKRYLALKKKFNSFKTLIEIT